MVQILHRGDSKSGHWFTVSTVGCNEGSVNWYDSSYNELDVDSKYQICSILKYDGKALKFNKIPVQSQQGAADCGLFAIAFAVALCLGNNPQKMVFNQDKMREHLVDCIESQNFTNFPFSVNTNWRKKRIVSTKENILCRCRGIYDSEMVQCSECALWFHLRCISESVRKAVEKDSNFQYKCDKC